MAWIVFNLDDTLLTSAPPMEPQLEVEGVPQEPQQEEDMPTPGSVEACNTLAGEGHRLTVYTSRFAPMPDSERQRMKEEIEQKLASMGFPPMEVWTGTTKPAADFFVGHDHITFDNDWGLALAQLQVMMEERGLVPGPQPDGLSMEGEQMMPIEDGNAVPEQEPEE